MVTTKPRCTRLAITAGPPPTIVVEYECPESSVSRNKSTADDCVRIDHLLRRKTIRLHNLADSLDSAETVAHRLGRKFPRHLGPNTVKHAQLQGLVLKLKHLVKEEIATPRAEVSQTRPDKSGVTKTAAEDQDQGQEQDGGDLNLASENELAAAKMRMNVIFEQNLLMPGAPGYVHDVRRDFDQAQEECDWDEDSSED